MARPDNQVYVLYKDNDLLVELAGLKNGLTEQPYNSATVQLTLTDEAGTQVTGASWPVAMQYVSNSDGTYRVGLEEALQLSSNARYVATITADVGGGLKGKWTLPCVCRTRH